MKKVLTILSLAAVVSGTPTFGQGFLQLSSAANTIFDGFSTPNTSVAGGPTESYALYWAPVSTANPFNTLTGLGNTPTTGKSTTSETWTSAQAWSALTGAASWTLGVDDSSYGPADGGGTIQIKDTVTAGGVLTFYSQDTSGAGPGFAFDLVGSTAGNLALLVVGYNTFGSGAIGWSYLSSFKTVASSTDPTIASPNFTPFGVFVPASVPEPSTLALAGLGGFGMLMAFRRKKT